MKKIIEYYVYSNFHIAICAVAALYSGYSFFQIKYNIWSLVFIFMGTIITYSVHRIIGQRKIIGVLTNTSRFKFFNPDNNKIHLGLSLIGTAIAAFALLQLNITLQLGYVGLSLISTLYILPLFGSGKRLRDLGNIKIFLIAIVWGAIFILPVLDDPNYGYRSANLILFIEKFLFIFALTLPFDIRDKHLDNQTSVSTLVHLLSDRVVRNMILISLLGAMSMVIISLYMGVYDIYLSASMILFYCLQAVLCYSVKDDTSELYYLGCLDALILVHGGIIILNTIL